MTRPDATAITRELAPLTSGRLTTTTVGRPHSPSRGFRVDTTRVLTRQLAEHPDGDLVVKRRVAAALGLDDPYAVGVCIAADRGTIDIVAPGRTGDPR